MKNTLELKQANNLEKKLPGWVYAKTEDSDFLLGKTSDFSADIWEDEEE